MGVGFLVSFKQLKLVSVLVKEGELAEADDVLAVDGIALGEDGHFANDLAACHLNEMLKREERAARGYNALYGISQGG